MEYTKGERREIYLKAAELIKQETFCCHAIKAVTGIEIDETCHIGGMVDRQNVFIQKYFPEFFLFKPTGEEIEYKAIYSWHFNGGSARVNALLLCAEMCND